MKTIRKAARKTRNWLTYLLLDKPFVGTVNFGDLRRLKPIDSTMGYGRGEQSVARYYIDWFIRGHQDDIRGHVLEIGDNRYTLLGGERVTKSDVLHIQKGSPLVTIVADLTRADEIPSDTFDCIILTQTLQCIHDVHAAIGHVSRILKPGGVLLATLSGISQICRYDMDHWGEFWRFTTISTKRLFGEFFPSDHLHIQAHGNVLAATALLYGLASRELLPKELDYRDADYEVIITVRAVKSLKHASV